MHRCLEIRYGLTFELPVFLALLLSGMFAVGCGTDTRPPSEATVIRNGTLIEGTGASPVADAVVIARAGTIEVAGPAEEIEIPDNADILDAADGFIVPGYIDAHVHYSQTGWFDGRPDAADLREQYPYAKVIADLKAHPERFFRAHLCSGVTATFDVGGYPWTRDLQARGSTDPYAPRVAAAGALLSTVDFWLNLPDQQQFVYMSDEAAVRETVRSHARLGSSAIKVWFITPPDPPDSTRAVRLVEAASEEAEAFRLPFVVHATGLWEAKEAIRAGADVLVHSVFDEPVDSEFLDLAAENDVVYTTTLTVQEGYRNARLSGGFSVLPYPTTCVDEITRTKIDKGIPSAEQLEEDPSELALPPGLQTGLQNLKEIHDAGITIAMGTDAGNPGTLHGPSVYREMELLARGGMSPLEVLAASTRHAARAMGRSEDLGTLESGKRADIVILSENPAEDTENLRSVQQVIKNGRSVWTADDGFGP